MLRRTTHVLLLAALAALVSACQLRTDVLTTVNGDGSGTITIEVAADQQLLQQLQEATPEGDDPLAQFDSQLPDTWTAEPVTYTQDGREFTGRRASRQFDDLDELAELVDGALTASESDVGEENQESSAPFRNYTIVRDGNTFQFNATAASGFAPPATAESDDSEVEPLVVTTSVELPGTIEKHNADEVDGNVLRWNIDPDQGRSLHATSTNNTPLAFWAAAFLLGAVLVGGTAALFARRS